MGELLGYARVSTLEQDAALQHDALSAAGCFRTWTDTASGSLTDRPELVAVMDALRPGDTLVVWRLDRLGRSLPHLIETVRDLAARGVGFRSLQETIDTTTPGGRLVFHVFGSLAEFERDLIRERTMAGLAAARRRGRVGGRPTVMTAAKTKQAARMVTAGTPLTEVADVLGVSRTTLYRHLKATQSTGVVSAPAQSLPPVVVLRASVVGERSVRACPSCGDEPRTREEAMALRADLAVRWLHPDPQSVPLSNRWDAEASMLRSDSWPGPATAIATYSGSEDRRFGSVIVASALTPHASYVDFGAPLAAAERAPGDTTPLLADDGDHPSLSGPDPNAGTLLTAIITTSGVPVAVG